MSGSVWGYYGAAGGEGTPGPQGPPGPRGGVAPNRVYLPVPSPLTAINNEGTLIPPVNNKTTAAYDVWFRAIATLPADATNVQSVVMEVRNPNTRGLNLDGVLIPPRCQAFSTVSNPPAGLMFWFDWRQSTDNPQILELNFPVGFTLNNDAQQNGFLTFDSTDKPDTNDNTNPISGLRLLVTYLRAVS